MITTNVVYKWVVIYYSNQHWGFSSKGECFMTSGVIQYRKFEKAPISYKGFNLDMFANAWARNLEEVRKQSSGYSFATELAALIDWVADDGCKLEELEILIPSINTIELLETVVKITDIYQQQFNLLLDGCNTYEDFKDVIDFLEDLPHEFESTLHTLISQSEETPFLDEEINDIPITMQEKHSQMWKEGVEIISTPSSYFYFGGMGKSDNRTYAKCL